MGSRSLPERRMVSVFTILIRPIEFLWNTFLMKDWSIAAGSIGQLQKELDAAKEAQWYAESQREAGYRVLTRSHEENDKLKAENQQQAQEIENLKAQLALSQEENQKLKSGIFGECDPAVYT